MAVVYAAEQVATGQPRALKLMYPELLDDETLRARFEQEARVGALIPSAHVVSVIDAGVDADTAAPWIAMELLDGEDLEAYVARRGPLPLAEALEVLRQVCHALGAAHEVGVIHRDLKPQNVFVAVSKAADDAPSIKILDFGIAKVVAEANKSTVSIGTPLWMSPEHSEPRAVISPAADVWSLGLLAFWLLTGKELWRCAQVTDAAMQAILRELLLEPVPRASERAHELGVSERIPPGFDGWFERCLARAPAERFAHATEAYAALIAALGDVEPAAELGAPASSGVHERVRKAFEKSARISPARSSSPKAAALDGGASPRASRSTSLAQIGLVALSTSLVLSAAAAYALGLLRIGPDAAPASAATGPAAVEAGGQNRPDVSPSAPSPSLDAPALGPPADSGVSLAVEPATTVAPVAVAPASAPVAPPKPQRPFDAAAAHAALQRAGARAKLACIGREGPRGVSATVFFHPAGVVQRVLAGSPEYAATQSYLCMSATLHQARVPPFDGDELASVVTSVTIP